MRVARATALVVIVALAMSGCSDDSGSDAGAPSARAPSEPPDRIAIAAQMICGPTDQSTVEVRVQGTRAQPLTAELLLDGQVVATSDPVHTTRDRLLIDLPLDPEASVQNDILTILDITGARVRVRQAEGGRILAVDRTIDPYSPPPGGGCG